MTSKQFRILVIVTIIAGFLGGAASDLLLRGVPVLAQATAKVPDVVKARSFQVVDAEGKVQAKLGMLTGEEFLESDSPPVPGLVLFDDANRPRAVLRLEADGGPSLRLADSTGEPRAALALLADGGAGLSLADSAGKLRATLVLEADGTAGLGLADSAGKPRAALAFLADGRPGLSLWDSTGELIWGAP